MSWSLFNYFKKAPIAEASKQTNIAPKIEEHDQVDEEVLALINDSAENDSLLRRDSLLASLEFKLNTASIRLGDIAELKFEKSIVLFEALPRHDSVYFQLNLGSFYLYDCYALEQNTNQGHFSTIIRPLRKQLDQDEFVFQILYEHNPFPSLNRNYSDNLTIKSCGLDIVYNLVFFEKLKLFLNSASAYYETTSVVAKIAKKSTNNLKPNKIYSSPISKIKFDFEITAPRVVFPQDFQNENSLVVIFDFGRLAFLNRVKNTSNNDTNNQNIIVSYSITFVLNISF